MKRFTIVFILSLLLLFCNSLIMEANIKPKKSKRKNYPCKDIGKPKVKPYSERVKDYNLHRLLDKLKV